MQLDLFEQEATDREQRLEIKTRYRTNDPDTSRDAAESLVTSGRLNAQCERVLRLLKAHNGCTSAELAHQTDTDRSMIARRLPDLEKRGLVYKGETRKCEINGTNAKPWFVLLLLFASMMTGCGTIPKAIHRGHWTGREGSFEVVAAIEWTPERAE